MTGHGSTQQLELDQGEELLSWENLGAEPAGSAFRRSMRELLARPDSFFRKMAVSGGLHEPLTFFAIVAAAGLLIAFPAALSYCVLSAPDPERVTPQAYSAHMLPARVSGLLLVLTPLVLVGGAAAMVLLGTLFHLAGKPFAARSWEASVSVWVYSVSAALMPLVFCLGVAGAVSLAGYLIGIPWPGTRDTAAPLARWTWLVLGSAGLLAGAALLVVDASVGTTRALAVDLSFGITAGVSGVIVAAAAVTATAWGVGRGGVRGTLIAACGWVLFAFVAGVAGIVRSRRAARSS
jgi:hypothetical protein